MKYLTLSWKKYHQYVFKLSQKIIKDGNYFDLIITVARGGLTLSHLLSDFMNLPVATFTVSSYKDLNQVSIPKIVFKLGDKLNNKKILLVDDISDTGKTFIRGIQYVKSLGAENIKTASLIIKFGTEFTPDYYSKSVSKKTWVIFPTEMKETIIALKEKLSKKELKKLKLPKKFIEYYF